MASCSIHQPSKKNPADPAIKVERVEVSVYSSPDLPLHNRYPERDFARDLDAERARSGKRSARLPQRRPSIIRRLFRSLFRFSFTVLLGVGATLGWQSRGHEAKQVVETWAPSLGRLLPVPTTASPAAAAPPSAPAQQLEPVARELAIVRHSLDQLAAKQEQMAHSIATLRADQPLSATPSWAAPMLPSKPTQPRAKSASPSPPPARQPMVLR
jgi:hypothetical protein